jgi:hypothetical protein
MDSRLSRVYTHQDMGSGVYLCGPCRRQHGLGAKGGKGVRLRGRRPLGPGGWQGHGRNKRVGG